MRHIRFLKSQATICMHPELLGTDFVTVDHPIAPNDFSCRECTQLLVVHNERMDWVDNKWDDIVRNYNANQNVVPSSPIRGIVIGCLICSIFWIAMFLLFWWRITHG